MRRRRRSGAKASAPTTSRRATSRRCIRTASCRSSMARWRTAMASSACVATSMSGTGPVADARLRRAALLHQQHAQRIHRQPGPAQGRSRRQPEPFRRGRVLVPAGNHQRRRLAFLRWRVERLQPRLRPRTARGALPHPRRRAGFIHRCRWRGHWRQSRQPGPSRLPARRRDRPLARQLGRICRRRARIQRALHDRPGRTLRELQPLRRHSQRQTRARLQGRRCAAVARLGQHRFPRTVAAAEILHLDHHRLHQW